MPKVGMRVTTYVPTGLDELTCLGITEDTLVLEIFSFDEGPYSFGGPRRPWYQLECPPACAGVKPRDGRGEGHSHCVETPGWGRFEAIPLPDTPEGGEKWHISGQLSDVSGVVWSDPPSQFQMTYDLVATPGDIREVTVWLNAFIPETISGVTKKVPGTGTHSGKTMIPSTFWGDCFLTDQRTYDSSRAVKQRMRSLATFDLVHEKMTEEHFCNLTTEVDCGSGNEEETGTGKKDRMKWKDLKVSEDGLTYTANLSAAASNPLVSASRLIGDIDYEGALRIELNDDGQSATVSFKGKVDTFPAFEMYACADDEQPVLLFKEDPQDGRTGLTLGGNANRPISGKKTVYAKQ